MSIVSRSRAGILIAAAVLIAGAVILLWQLSRGSERLSSSGNPGLWTVEQVTAFPDYTVLWLGEEFEGLPLTGITRDIADDDPKSDIPTNKNAFFFFYGSCTPEDGDSCPIPIAVYIQPRCYLPPELLPAYLKEGPTRTVRGGAQLALMDRGSQVDIWTGDIAVTIFNSTGDPSVMARAVDALRPLNKPGDASSALAAPETARCAKIKGRDRDDVRLPPADQSFSSAATADARAAGEQLTATPAAE